MKFLVSALLCLVTGLAPAVAAKEITPLYELATAHMVTDILVDGGSLYAATFGGTVEVFDIASKTGTQRIALPKIRDFMGDEVPPKIYAIDRFDERLMIVSEGKSGYRNVHLYEAGKLRQLVDSDEKLFIKKGLFVDGDCCSGFSARRSSSIRSVRVS